MAGHQDPPSGPGPLIASAELSALVSSTAIPALKDRGGAESLLAGGHEVVGRAREIARLEELFHAAVYRRQTTAVLIHGPEGVGKQRLFQEVVGRLIGSGARFRLLDGRPLGRELGMISALLRSRFKDELESSMPAKALVTTLRMLVPTHEVVEVCFTVASMLGVELGARHASLESLGELLDDPIRRKPFLVDILQRLFKREAERLPLCVLLRHPEEGDKESQEILSEVMEGLSELPLLVVSLQREVSVVGRNNARRFVPSYTGPGAATITDFDIARLGGAAEDPNPVTRRVRKEGEIARALAEAARSPARSEAPSPEPDADQTLMLDNATERFYEAPRVFGLACELMALRPLPDAQMESLVRRVLEPVRDLPDALVGMLVARLEGVPGRLRPHLTALVSKGLIERGEGGWVARTGRLRGESIPSDLEGLARSRVEALPAKHRGILELAAVVGSFFGFTDVLTLMRLDLGQGDGVPFFETRTESRLRRVLLDLQGQEFTVYEPRLGPHGDEAFRFKVERERELLLEGLDPDRVRLLHRILAQVLERHGAPEEEISRHWAEGGAARRASLSLLRAGMSASRASKAQKAIETLRVALDGLGLDEGEDYLEGLACLAHSNMVLGEFAQVESLCGALAQGAYAIGAPLHGSRALLLRATASRHTGALDKAAEHLRQALELAGRLSGAPALALRAEILDELSLTRWQHGAHFSEALELADKALAIREELGDVVNTARTLLNIGQIQYARHNLDDAQGCFERAARLAESEDLRQVLAKAKNGLGILAMTRGDHMSAQRLWAEVLDISQALGDRALRAAVLSNLGELAWLGNNGRLATDLLRRSVDLARSIGEFRVSSESLRLLSRIALAEVQLDDAVALAMQALDEARRSGAGLRVALALRNMAEVLGHTLFSDSFKDADDVRTQIISAPRSSADRAKEARGCFEEAIGMLDAMGNRMDLRDTLASYRMFLIERGQGVEAEAIERRLAAIG